MSTSVLSREKILNDLGLLKPELKRRYGINKLGLFGSFARNTSKPNSDIDVVIELSEPDLFVLVHIKEELESFFKRSVDVIPFSDTMNSFLKDRIKNEAVYV